MPPDTDTKEYMELYRDVRHIIQSRERAFSFYMQITLEGKNK